MVIWWRYVVKHQQLEIWVKRVYDPNKNFIDDVVMSVDYWTSDRHYWINRHYWRLSYALPDSQWPGFKQTRPWLVPGSSQWEFVMALEIRGYKILMASALMIGFDQYLYLYCLRGIRFQHSQVCVLLCYEPPTVPRSLAEYCTRVLISHLMKRYTDHSRASKGERYSPVI